MQPRVQVGDQRGHLLLGEAAAEAGHHALPCQHILPHGRVGGGSAAGQGLMVEDAVQIRRNLFESQVVFFMAVGAAKLIKALAFRLLRSQRRRCAAAGPTGCRCNAKEKFTVKTAQIFAPPR